MDIERLMQLNPASTMPDNAPLPRVCSLDYDPRPILRANKSLGITRAMADEANRDRSGSNRSSRNRYRAGMTSPEVAMLASRAQLLEHEWQAVQLWLLGDEQMILPLTRRAHAQVVLSAERDHWQYQRPKRAPARLLAMSYLAVREMAATPRPYSASARAQALGLTRRAYRLWWAGRYREIQSETAEWLRYGVCGIEAVMR